MSAKTLAKKGFMVVIKEVVPEQVALEEERELYEVRANYDDFGVGKKIVDDEKIVTPGIVEVTV